MSAGYGRITQEEVERREEFERMAEARFATGYFDSDPTGAKTLLALKFLFSVGAMAVPLINICIAGEWSIFGYWITIMALMLFFNVVDTIMFNYLKNAMHWILAPVGGDWRMSSTYVTLNKKVDGIRTRTLVILTSQWTIFLIIFGWGVAWFVNHEKYTDVDSKQHTPDKQTDAYNQLRVFSGFIVFAFGYLIVGMSHLMISISTAEDYKHEAHNAYQKGLMTAKELGTDYPESRIPVGFAYDASKPGSRVEQFMEDIAWQINNRLGLLEKPYGDFTVEQRRKYTHEITAFSWILFALSCVGFVHSILFALLLIGIHTGGGLTLYMSFAILEGALFAALVILYVVVARNNFKTYHPEMFSALMFWGMLMLLQMVIYVYGSSVGVDFGDNIPKFVETTVPPFPKLGQFFYPFQTLLCFVTAFITWFASYFAVSLFMYPIDESISTRAPVYGWWKWYAFAVTVSLAVLAGLSIASLNSWVGLNEGFETFEWTFLAVYFVVVLLGFIILFMAYKDASQYTEDYYEGIFYMARSMFVFLAWYGLGVFLIFGTSNEKYHGFGHETFNGDAHYKSVLNPHEEISVGWYNMWFTFLLATVILILVLLESVMTDTLSVTGKVKNV